MNRRCSITNVLLLILTPAWNQSQYTAMAESAGSNSETSGPSAIAREFLASLNEDARKTVSRSFDDLERKRWRRDPGPRPGLAMKDMTDDQRRKIEQLMATVLSNEGMLTVNGIREEQNILGKSEEGLGEGYYWFAIFGEPGNGRWAWRFGGHHVSLHVTYDMDTVISTLPLHLGGQILGDSSLGWNGYRRLKSNDQLARKLLMSLSERQRQDATLVDHAPARMVLSEPSSHPWDSLPQEGIAVSDLSAEQRRIVEEILIQFTNRFAPQQAKAIWDQTGGLPPDLRFVWSGSSTDLEPHYFRLQSQRLVIEYADSGTHMHTIVRSPQDYGGP